MATLLDGRALSKTIRENVAERRTHLSAAPGLAVLLVGQDPASHTYVRLKGRACETAGIRFERFDYPADASTETLVQRIEELNAREDIHGILVQLPLPSQDTDRVIAAIDPRKDVDGFHPENLRRFRAGEPALVSPVALGVMKLIDATGVSLRGLHATVVASELFGQPFVDLLSDNGADARIVSPEDPTHAEQTKTADIVITAVGQPNFLRPAEVKPGAIVIDVGTTRVDDRIVGDVDPAVSAVAGFMTPVPGGVGPMTVAMLLVNVLKAYQLQRPARG